MKLSYDPSVCPIYEANSSGLVHRGSCLLVKTTNRFWIFTASHVVVDCTDSNYRVAPLWLPGKPQFQPIDTENIHYCPKGIDVAFFEIAAEKAAIVAAGQAAFLPASALAPLAVITGRALVSGYPDKAVQLDGGELTVEVRQFQLRAPFLTEQELVRAKLDPSVHVAVHAMNLRDDEATEKTGRINFRGLSGGAIQRDGPRSAPVALVTDYDPKREIVVGTRLNWLIRQVVRKLEQEKASDQPGGLDAPFSF